MIIAILAVAVVLLAAALAYLTKLFWGIRTDLQMLVEETAGGREDLQDTIEDQQAQLDDAHNAVEMVLETEAPPPAPVTDEERAAFDARIQDLESQLRDANRNLEMVLNNSPKEGS